MSDFMRCPGEVAAAFVGRRNIVFDPEGGDNEVARLE
jgi:hypothetical protein